MVFKAQHAFATVLSLIILVGPIAASAQIIIIPDCDLFPQDPFCQDQCVFDPTLPWCAPPEPERDPIVLVPPLIASYNKKLMFKDKPGGELKFVTFGNTFKGLIKKLEQAGYELDKDLFVAHYDWRQSNTTSAQQYLVPVIQQAKQETEASKVDLVAHSMGGLVARSYIQGDSYANDVDQLITLGTPHAGAADAYVAWEGGFFPDRWDRFIRFHIYRIEGALQKTRNMKTAKRPETFRNFFPSLKELLPIDNFVQKNEDKVAINDLTEQNAFLENLRDTFDVIGNRGVNLTTIAGQTQNTLEVIRVTDDRTPEDIDRERWRDGHPNPDPPPADTNTGDETVLLSSAHLGNDNLTINNTRHIELPDGAQDQVIETLGLDEVSEQYETKLPKKLFGIIIMSPLVATIEGPNGEILSNNQNDFSEDNAEYDNDPNDPDDLIDIIIADPPDGQYKITYTGTDEGEYTIITTYADDDETISSTKEGDTELGKTETEIITINNDTISLIDDTDYKALLKEIISLAKKAKKDKLIKGYDQANLTRPVTHARNDLRIYEKRLQKDREEAAYDRLNDYYEELDEIEQIAHKLSRKKDCQDLAAEILQLLEKIRIYSPPLS